MMEQMPKTICWNAIVKNEAKVIERCMAAMAGELDYWVVVDTGSTDGTQDIIRNFMAQRGIPGELHERPWVNFAHNRNEALELAEGKADYILFCDADMALVVHDPHWKYQLHHDAYLVTQKAHQGRLEYPNIRLVNARLQGDKRFRYWGATHEYCDSIEPGLGNREQFAGISMLDFADGGAKTDKYIRDAALLKQHIAELQALEQASPGERAAAYQSGLLRHAPGLLSRSLFYLAKTLDDADLYEDAIQAYQQRIAHGGWEEETWFALLRIARLKEIMGKPLEEISQAYLAAYQYRPQRAESLYHLARYLRMQEQFALAYVYALAANNTPLPNDLLFVEGNVYRWQAQDEQAVAAYWIGRYAECATLCKKLLDNPHLPASHRPRIEANLQYAEAKL